MTLLACFSSCSQYDRYLGTEARVESINISPTEECLQTWTGWIEMQAGAFFFRWNSHNLKHFIVNNSVAFSPSAMLCNHHLYLVMKHSYYSKMNPLLIHWSFPIPTCPWQPPICLLFLVFLKKYSLHLIKFTLFGFWLSFDKCIQLCNHHHNQDTH